MTIPRAALVAGTALLVAVGVLTWAAFAPMPETGGALSFVIPPGTEARLRAGRPANVLPATVHLTVGVHDVLVITNDDEAIHQVG
ncbi:MAG TPA: hypothetical protein VIX40_11535, partial [Methylomirabilota bacterium]